MAQPTIELMTERDVEAVARLRLATFFAGTARTLDDDVAGLRGLLDGDGFEAAFVARDGGKPVGSCLLVRHEIDEAHDLTPWLAGLVVEPACRGLGIGEGLVRTVEAQAAAAGVDTLHLYTWEARRFYERLGWSAVETFMEEGEPMLLMRRAL
jgi:predicted N-acetyltransferase YhbS